MKPRKYTNVTINTNIYISVTTQIAKYKTMGKKLMAYHYSRKQIKRKIIIDTCNNLSNSQKHSFEYKKLNIKET